MSKHTTSAQARPASQPPRARRQRRRPRGEVYRQPPRVRARTQSAVQVLDSSGSSPRVEPVTAPAATEEPPVATSTAEPPTAEPPTAQSATRMDTSPIGEPATPDGSQSSSRLPRRTRTLADVVQPRRDPGMSSGAFSVPSVLSVPDLAATGSLREPAPSSSDSAAMVPAATSVDTTALKWTPQAQSEPVGAGDEHIDESGAKPSDTPQDKPRESEPRTAPLAAVRGSEDATDGAGNDSSSALRRPIASNPVPRSTRESVPTRSISGSDGEAPAARPGPRARVGDPWGTSPAAMKYDEELPSRFLRGARHGLPALAGRVAAGHGIAAVALAVVASALVLLAYPLGLWLLALAALVAAGGGLAYLLLWWRRSARLGLLVLALAQMGALAWGCALLGPRAALLVLAAPAVALALRAGGRGPALLVGTGMVAIYVVFQFAPTWGISPAFVPPVPVLTAVDTLAVALGIALLLAELFVAGAARERDLAAARARLYEVRLLRGQIGAVRAEVEDGGRALNDALAQAVRGRDVDPVALDGPLSLVAERVNLAAERLRTLRQDRAARLRLESAIRTLARTLERGWLGLPWVWPESSGTMVDEVIALLRTPRPADSLAEAQLERRASSHSGPLAHITAYPAPAVPELSGWEDGESA